MRSFQPSDLRHQAEDALRYATYDPKKLTFLHTAVALGSSLLLTLVNLLINQQIANTGGLSGMGLRSVLSTLQSVLDFAVMVALPFWEIGLIFAALGWSRKEQPDPAVLLRGFRQFRSVLALNLLRVLLLFIVGFFIVYLISAVYMFTPLSEPLWKLIEPLYGSNMTTQEIEAFFTPEMLDSMMRSSIPMLVISGVAYASVAVFLFYRLRFAEYALADGTGAFGSLLRSVRLTGKKRSLAVLKLDLHFWWYYLVIGLLLVVYFGDMILAAAGVALPVSADMAAVLFSLVATVCRVVFCRRYLPVVATTYAVTYQSFCDAAATDTVQANAPYDAQNARF